MPLAKTVKRLRLARKLTQTALAKKIGVSQAFVAQLESGAYSPSLATLGRLAKALKVSVAKLLS